VCMRACVCVCALVCVCVCVCHLLIMGKWLLLSPLCYVTLQSNYTVCALFRGCLIMLFGSCGALGCHRACVCVCVCVCSLLEDTNCGGGVNGTATVSERARGKGGEREKRENKPECISVAFPPARQEDVTSSGAAHHIPRHGILRRDRVRPAFVPRSSRVRKPLNCFFECSLDPT